MWIFAGTIILVEKWEKALKTHNRIDICSTFFRALLFNIIFNDIWKIATTVKNVLHYFHQFSYQIDGVKSHFLCGLIDKICGKKVFKNYSIGKDRQNQLRAVVKQMFSLTSITLDDPEIPERRFKKCNKDELLVTVYSRCVNHNYSIGFKIEMVTTFKHTITG